MSIRAHCRVQPGDLVAGRYRVERMLGAGGMGVVVAATQIELDRVVALKFMQEALLESPDLVRRFSLEARAAARLQSEHVVRVLDVGSLDDGTPYFAMEYLDGDDLANVLASRGRLPCDQAIDIVIQACEALFEAHTLGIVHRDLKPANLFLAKRATGPAVVKVLDFGLSKLQRPGGGRVTSTSSVLGSPVYMSPEQLWSSAAADERSDVWSLGVVLYELLAGTVPFSGAAPPELVAAILHRPPRPFDEAWSSVAAEVRAAVLRCLEKDPAHRFQDVRDLARTIAPFGPESGRRLVDRMVPALSSASRVAAPSPETLPPVATTVAPPESIAGSSQSVAHRLGRGSLRSPRATEPRSLRARSAVAPAVVALIGAAALGGILVALRAPLNRQRATSEALTPSQPHAEAAPPSVVRAEPEAPPPAAAESEGPRGSGSNVTPRNPGSAEHLAVAPPHTVPASTGTVRTREVQDRLLDAGAKAAHPEPEGSVSVPEGALRRLQRM